MPDPTRQQDEAIERLGYQFDSVIVTPPDSMGRQVATGIDTPITCSKHADYGVRLDCPLCSCELGGQFIIEPDGSVRGS